MNQTLKVDWEEVGKVAGAVTAIAGAIAGISYMVKAVIEMKQAADKADETDESEAVS